MAKAEATEAQAEALKADPRQSPAQVMPVLAAAAYNAGPHRVSRWLPTDQSLQAELWMELIPYPETRTYVRRVLAYATVFEWRLQLPVTPLTRRMPAVQQRY